MFKYILFTVCILINFSVGANDDSNDSTDWKAVKNEDSFTGNKWCYVTTKFMKAPDGVYMRSLLIPVNQRAMNKRGEFFDINYNVTLGLMGSLKKGVQSNIDGTMVDMDNNIEKAIDSLNNGKQLRIRFEWSNKVYGTTQETHTINLDSFSHAWDEATSLCM